jgi:predicted HNH restriction endonuclease
MGKRLPTTPRSKIRQALRQLWLRSRERASALKNAKYCCEECGKKQSKRKGFEQKVEVHHIKPIDDAWDKIIESVFKHILIDPKGLKVLCPECHDKIHELDKKK